MSVTELKSVGEFRQLIQSNPVVLIDFWATWCGPCRVISPIFEKYAGQHGGKIKFAKVDVDEGDIGTELGIRAMPTFHLYVHGEKAGELVGANPQGLDKLVNQAVNAAP